MTPMPLAAFRRMFLTVFACVLACYAVAAEDAKKEAREVKVEDITLTVPADWKQQPPANRLRLAQFAVPNAEGDTEPTEMVVSHFGGTGGGIDANIERWVNQFASDGRKVKVSKGRAKQGAYYFVDVRGTYNMSIGPPIRQQTKAIPNARMLGVILEVADKGNYFLKLAGPEKTVSAQEDAMRASIGGDKKSEKPYELK
jgi:gluconolactonase